MNNNQEVEITKEEIVEEFGDMVSRMCFRMVPDPYIAEEAAQEVWYEVLKGLENFRGEAKISTWIYKIAYRVIKNYTYHEKLYDTTFLKHCFNGPKFEIPDRENYDKRL